MWHQWTGKFTFGLSPIIRQWKRPKLLWLCKWSYTSDDIDVLNPKIKPGYFPSIVNKRLLTGEAEFMAQNSILFFHALSSLYD